MLEDLKKSQKIVIGTKQVLKAAKTGKLQRAYVAEDADSFIKVKLLDELKQNNITVEMVSTMKELGEACRIHVGSAAAGILS